MSTEVKFIYINYSTSRIAILYVWSAKLDSASHKKFQIQIYKHFPLYSHKQFIHLKRWNYSSNQCYFKFWNYFINLIYNPFCGTVVVVTIKDIIWLLIQLLKANKKILNFLSVFFAIFYNIRKQIGLEKTELGLMHNYSFKIISDKMIKLK